MNYRTLGRTGLSVSALCMGTMQFGWTVDEPDSFRVLSLAYDAGINFFDSANIYSRWVHGNSGGEAESILGTWIVANNIPREKIILATKVRGRMGNGPDDEGLSRTHIRKAVEDSLRRLKTDYIDLYQAHWFDENTPLPETLSAMDDLVRAGKVRFIGVSNFSPAQTKETLQTSRDLGLVGIGCIQPHYSLVHREEFEKGLLKTCQENDLGVIPYSPLGAGFLTGKYSRGERLPKSKRASGVEHRHFSAKNWSILEKVEEVAGVIGTNTAAIALAWLLSMPTVSSPIIGPRNEKQLEENLEALRIKLSDETRNDLLKVSSWNAE